MVWLTRPSEDFDPELLVHVEEHGHVTAVTDRGTLSSQFSEHMVLRCECGWERRGVPLHLVATQALEHEQSDNLSPEERKQRAMARILERFRDPHTYGQTLRAIGRLERVAIEEMLVWTERELVAVENGSQDPDHRWWIGRWSQALNERLAELADRKPLPLPK